MDTSTLNDLKKLENREYANEKERTYLSNNIATELIAIAIIREKGIDLGRLEISSTCVAYNKYADACPLDDDEWSLLRKVFGFEEVEV